MTIKWFSVKLKNAPVNSFHWTVFRLLFLKMHKKIWILLQGSHISLSYRPGVKEEGSIMFWIATSSWYTRNEIRENDKKNQRIKTLQKWGDHHILMCEILRGHITVQSATFPVSAQIVTLGTNNTTPISSLICLEQKIVILENVGKSPNFFKLENNAKTLTKKYQTLWNLIAITFLTLVMVLSKARQYLLSKVWN